MRIECPFCGERDISEFTYLGDAGCRHPPPDSEGLAERFYEAVYLRDNPVGPHQELWYHAGGCHSWLRVTRNTRTHEIVDVQLAMETSRT
ncbi:MAG: sarcosine oxidase subunit delta [Steroidobacteraceae bacterium]